MDNIFLEIPAKPEYVLVARLTTSAVANRIDYNIDEIEDLKVAVAEAVIAIMNQNINAPCIKICYVFDENNGLRITIEIDKYESKGICSVNEDQRELSFFIIDSLMDNVEISSSDDVIYQVTMYKKCGGQISNG